MPVCPVCGKKSNDLGVLCTCTKAYTIHEGQTKDPLKLLGKQIGGKLVPVQLVADNEITAAYGAWQSAIERFITFIVLKPKFYKDENYKRRFLEAANKFSLTHQPNLPMLLEEMEMPKENMMALMCDERRGEPLLDFLKKNKPDDVIIVHIIHQILQALATYHRYDICVPNYCYENILIIQQGSDTAFVKVIGLLENIMSSPEESMSKQDDVWCMGQLALSLLTGQPIPITNVELDESRVYLMPIVQLFMRATAPIESRHSSASELLVDFETILDVRPKDNTIKVSKNVVDDSRVGKTPPKKNLVEFDQIIWMHKQPHIEDN